MYTYIYSNTYVICFSDSYDHDKNQSNAYRETVTSASPNAEFLISERKSDKCV